MVVDLSVDALALGMLAAVASHTWAFGYQPAHALQSCIYFASALVFAGCADVMDSGC